MAATEIKVQMQQRRDTAAGWTAANPTLLAGELGFESDTNKIKIGDGSTAWSSLSYIPGFSITAYPLATADIANDAITGDKLANNITIANNLTVTNDLTVNGTTTTVNSTTLQVDDKNIELGTVATPSDTTADGGGITLKGATDKTLTWVNSTDCWTFDQSLDLTAGTAAAPALVFDADVNTGIYHPAADVLAVSTAGSERLRIDANGLVGIGTSSPGDYDSTSNDLVVGEAGSGDRGITIASGTSSRGTVMFADGTTGLGEYAGYLQYHHNGDFLAIATNNAEAMRIDSSGNVGIGTTAPAVELDVSGTVRASTGVLFGSDTAAANTLDDYEEGTWTPVIAGAGTAGSYTYGVNAGGYTKIGNQVTAHFNIENIVVGTAGSGVLKIAGLPFTVQNTNDFFPHGSLQLSHVDVINNTVNIACRTQNNTTELRVVETRDAASSTTCSVTDIADNDAADLKGSITYIVA